MSKNTNLFTGNMIVLFGVKSDEKGRREDDGYLRASHPDLREWTERDLEDNDFRDLPPQFTAPLA